MTLPDDAVVEVVAFQVDGHRCALPLDRVVEIVRMVAVTPILDAPDWVAGIVNLRGTLIPLIDLRPRFGAARTPPDPRHVFLVSEAGGRTAAVLADQVEDVVQVPGSGIARASEVTGSEGVVAGLARAPDGAIAIIDLERLLHGDELDWAHLVHLEADWQGPE